MSIFFYVHYLRNICGSLNEAQVRFKSLMENLCKRHSLVTDDISPRQLSGQMSCTRFVDE